MLGDAVVLDRVGAWGADERIATQGFAEHDVTVDDRAARRGDLHETALLQHAGAVRTVDARRQVGGPGAQILDHALRHARDRRCTERARGHPPGHEVDQQGIAVGRDQQAAEVVDRLAPLALDRGGERHDAAAIGHEASVVLAGDERTVVAPGQRVARMLGTVEAGEARGHDRRRLSAAIAVGITRPQQVRRLDHEHTITVERDRPRKDQRFEDDLPLVHAAIAVSVTQADDAADGFTFARAVDVAHVARHLHDPERTIGMEGHGDRCHHHGLARDQLDAEPIGHAQRGQGLFGRSRRTVDGKPGCRQGRLRLALLVTLLGECRGCDDRREDRDRCAQAGHRPSVGRARTDQA